jgi:hypothetical protein
MDRVLARRALGVVLLLAAPARADSRSDYFSRLAAAVRSGLDEAVAARAPKLVPPIPIKVAWKAVRIGSLDLGAPLVAMTAGDLDGDGKGELYAVTSREVIAMGLDQRRIKELGRVPFSGERAALSPREVVGTAVVDGAVLVAGVSSWARELRVDWQGKTLTAQPGAAGFLVCPGERAALSPGRNHFGDPVTPVHGVRCRADMVDAEGHPLRVRATLGGTRLAITVARCTATGACEPAGTHEYKDYGVAFELADLDRNGTPELIVSGAGAPGDPDAIKVIALGSEDKKGLFRHRFNGGVAGLAVIDSDGDGAMELVAAVRLVGATRVDLWRFN